jgi:hypothetical protein
MSPIERQRLEAALELCSCLEGLIRTESVPPYMIDYLQSRVAKFRWLCGLPLKLVVTPEEIES